LTATKPYAPQHLVYVAVVSHAHPTQGKLIVKVQNGYELDEIHDVSAQSPVTGQTIVYNSGTSLWEKNTVSLTAGVNGTLPLTNGGTGQTSYTNGQLLIGNSTGNTLTKATLTAGTNISITNGSGAITINATDQYAGTVTSVNVSGGTTGLTTSGGPITSSGTITFAGTLNVANGGTGATSLTSGYLVKGNGTSAASASVVYDDGTNVGIGTSSPTNKLQVNGDVAVSYGNSGGNKFWTVFSNDYRNGMLLDGNNRVTQIFATTAAGDAGGIITFSTRQGTASGATDYGTERMRITAAGDVGIGTTSPAGKLDVVGIAYARSDISTGNSPLVAVNTNTGSNTTKYTSLLFQGYDTIGTNKNTGLVQCGPSDANYVTSYMAFQTRSGDALSERMRITSAGFVGIGTSSPQVGLHVSFADQSTNRIRLQNTGASGGNFDIIGGLAGASNAGLSFFDVTNAATRMYIDSSGNVAIGTSTPATKLEVYGGLIAGSENRQTHPNANGAGGFKAQWNYTGGGAETDLYNLYTGATTSFRFYQTTGNGTAQLLYNMLPSSHEFYTGGTLRFSISSTGAITSSDLADAVGYKGLPQNQQTSAYTLALADQGDHVYATAGAFAITIPANATTAFPIGAAITIVVEDAAKTVVPASGVTLVLAGTGAATTGTRTMAIGSVATLLKVGTNRWYISGAGVT
jgi:hypothetical protein